MADLDAHQPPSGRASTTGRGVRLGGGVIARGSLPGLTGQIDWALRKGELTSLLAGVYARPSDATNPAVGARAIGLADPHAVICGTAAAWLHGWVPDPGAGFDVASLALKSTGWLRVHRRDIPPELIRRVGGIKCTSRALTAIDLVPELGPGILDEALRRRVRLDELRAALTATPHRRGNAERALALADSRDEPWSEAERTGHRALRAKRIKGWVANFPVIADPEEPPIACLDIALKDLKLAFEIDGAQYHANADAFHRDRLRDERLALLGRSSGSARAARPGRSGRVRVHGGGHGSRPASKC